MLLWKNMRFQVPAVERSVIDLEQALSFVQDGVSPPALRSTLGWLA